MRLWQKERSHNPTNLLSIYMLHLFFRHLPFSRQKEEGFNKALTLIELLLTIAILGTLSAIAIPMYTGYLDKQRNTTALVDIKNIESQIERFKALSGMPPNDLAEAGIAAQNDPWGHSYQYVRLQGLSKHDQDAKCRWDKFDKPLNYDYDLYSMGKDGKTKPKLTDKDSCDDIIRANGGAYVGLASAY
jgi:general secretion pathway protein G